jgi:uncharacterized protein (DUF1778 family)
MVSFKNLTEAINEPKTARLEQRTKPHVKATIQRAADLMGIDETAFVTSAAYERALAAIAAHESTVLTEEDRKIFVAALEDPAPPTAALKKLFARHENLVVDGE